MAAVCAPRAKSVAEAPLISVIDDDASLREALCGLLRSLGYRARDFASAEDFLAGNGASESACIVTDIHMPGLSGIALKERLSQEGVQAPVIMITGRGEPALRERAFASGAHCVLSKPFTPEALTDCIDRALARR